MGWLTWIVLGLIAGIIAKVLVPGRDPGGIIVTILIGIVGGVAGGYVSTMLGFGTVTGINLNSVLIASGGAIGLLIIFRIIAGRR